MGPSTGRPTASGQRGRYATIAMALHWTIAALILTQIGLGWYMNEVLPDHSPAQDQIQTLHISIGLTTLMLIAARIGVRLAFPPPPLPAGLQGWEKALAGFGHGLFYLLMILLPLSGWALVSVHKGPISFWGLNWPKLPGLGFLKTPDHKSWREALQASHTTVFIYIILANLALHVAGALKNQFDGQPVLWRMIPFMRRPG
jgi:cytochrome b561